MTRRARRDSAMKPNGRGQFVKRVGKLSNGKAPVFSLGKDLREARIRLGRIRDLWDLAIVGTGRDYWTEYDLRMARSLASGVPYVVPSRTIGEDPFDWTAPEYAQHVESVRKVIHDAVPDDPDLFKRGQMINEAKFREIAREMIREEMEVAKEIGILSSNYGEESLDGSLFDVFSAYETHLRSKPASPWRETEIDQLRRLQEAHQDVPLARLDFHGIQSLVDYWRLRPIRSTGEVYAAKTCRNQIKTLFAALRYASRSNEFEWRLPAETSEWDRAIKQTQQERREKRDQAIRTYSVDQLRQLFIAANDLDRCLLLLGVNCGMGAAESGRLTTEDCFIEKRHPRADWITGFDFKEGQSFISFVRPKSNVLGDWLLWGSTTEYLKIMNLRARKLGSEVIICRSSGAPLYDENVRNAQSGFANRWRALVKRVQKIESDFPYLPFGSLRDCAAETMRQQYDAELASMVISHGSPVDDKLLQFYSNQPVGKLFDALRELEGYYSPIWS